MELEEKFRNVAIPMEVKLSEFETLFTVRRDKGKEKKEELKHDAIFQKENRPALIVSPIPHTLFLLTRYGSLYLFMYFR